MDLVPVLSSNLRAVGYDPKTQILHIAFLSGALYEYYDISPEIYNKLMKANSHGSYFYENIKNGKYLFKKIR